MADVAIYTATYGGYDRLWEPVAQDIDVEWVAFTDDDQLAPVGPWEVVLRPPERDHPRMAAKVPRCLPHVWLPEHPLTIWVDANMEITSPAFAREALAAMVDGFATWQHPQRSCIYVEARASLKLAPAKYADQPIMAQVGHYRRERFPQRGGLFATGTLARDSRFEIVRAMGEQWLAECDRWTYQDQLSLPVVCRRLGITPGIFPHRQIEPGRLGNPWLMIRNHLGTT